MNNLYKWLVLSSGSKSKLSVINTSNNSVNSYYGRHSLKASNGLTYFVPFNGTKLTEYDQSNDNISYYGNFSTSGAISGCVEYNGKLFLMPQNDTQFYEFDLNTKLITPFLSVSQQDFAGSGVVSGSKWFLTEYNRDENEYIDLSILPYSKTTFGSYITSGINKFHEGYVNNNNQFIEVGWRQNNIKITDVNTLSVSEIQSPFPSFSSYVIGKGAVVGDSKYYGMFSSNRLVIINLNTNAVSFSSIDSSISTINSLMNIDSNRIMVVSEGGGVYVYDISLDSFYKILSIEEDIRTCVQISNNVYLFMAKNGTKIYKYEL